MFKKMIKRKKLTKSLLKNEREARIRQNLEWGYALQRYRKASLADLHAAFPYEEEYKKYMRKNVPLHRYEQ